MKRAEEANPRGQKSFFLVLAVLYALLRRNDPTKKEGQYPLLPLSEYSAPGGLRQGPGRALKSPSYEGGADGLRIGFPGDRSDAGRGRRRQGRAPGGAFADRRPPRA